MAKNQQVIGYLPDEKPPVWKLLLYAIQQVIVMFPATVAVALITGFHVSTTIFASGLATICFGITRLFIPARENAHIPTDVIVFGSIIFEILVLFFAL